MAVALLALSPASVTAQLRILEERFELEWDQYGLRAELPVTNELSREGIAISTALVVTREYLVAEVRNVDILAPGENRLRTSLGRVDDVPTELLPELTLSYRAGLCDAFATTWRC